MSQEGEAISDLKDYQGATPEDFFAEDERMLGEERKIKGDRTAYRGWGELLQLWYAWCEDHKLEPVTDFREQTKLFVKAEDEASSRASKIVFGDVPDHELKKLSDDEKYELLHKHHKETEQQTREVLQERGYITLFRHFTLTVNPETLEVEKQELFKKPPQRNVPMYAKALYKLDGTSSVTWQDFYNHYIGLLTARGTKEAEGFSDHNEVQGSDMARLKAGLPQHIWAFSHMPTQTVDRAARGARGWSFPLDDAPTFNDTNNKHAVTYFADGLTQEALREGVIQLNPRTADVWRLCTATILESWGEGEKEPPRVWLDARKLCDTMGFKKHHKGGHRPENVAIAARALVDLERFHITIPLGAKQYPEDSKTGKRKEKTVQARARHRVLAVMAKEEIKRLFDTEWLPLRWQVTAGDWIRGPLTKRKISYVKGATRKPICLNTRSTQAEEVPG